MIRRILIATLLAISFAGSVFAQETVTPLPDNLQPITVENADQLQEIARIGNGVFNRGIAYSPDGNTLVVGGSIGLWLYDANNLNAPPMLIDLDTSVYDVAFSSDGRYLVYGSDDVHVMDFASREEVLRVEGAQFALHPDGNLLAVSRLLTDSAEDCEFCDYYPRWLVEFWSVENGELLRTINEDSVSNTYKFMSYVAGIVFSPDGQTLAITLSGFIDDACADVPKLVIFLDLSFDSDVQPSSVQDRDGRTFTADGSVLVGITNFEYSWWDNGSVFVWDVEAQQERFILDDDNPDDSVHAVSLALSPDSRIVTATADNRLLRWNIQTGELLSDVSVQARFRGVTYSPDGAQVIAVTPSALQIWDAELTTHHDIFLADAFTSTTARPSSRIINAQDSLGQNRMWLVNSNDVVEYLLPEGVGYQLSRNYGVGISLQSGQLHVWDTSLPIEQSYMLDDQFSADDQLALSDDGSVLAQQTVEHDIFLWNLESGELITRLHFDFGQGGSISFSPNAELFAMTYRGEEDSEGHIPVSLQVWSIRSAEQVYSLQTILDADRNPAWGVSFSEDGRRIAVSNHQHRGEYTGYQTSILSTQDYELIHYFTGYGSTRFTPDYRTLIVDGGDMFSVSLTAYDVDTGDSLSDIPFYGSDTGGIVGMSNDASHLLVETANVYQQCGGYIHRLYLVEVPTMHTILDIGLPIVSYDWTNNSPQSQTFNSDISLLLVSNGYSMTIYDVEDGTEINSLDGINRYQAYFNPDDTLIVSTGEDGTIRLYGVLADS